MDWYVHINDEKILMPSLSDDGYKNGDYTGGLDRRLYEDIVAGIMKIDTSQCNRPLDSRFLKNGHMYTICWPGVDEYAQLCKCTHADLVSFIRGMNGPVTDNINKITFDEFWEE